MKRVLLLLHRYLGIAVGWVVAAWCVSGVVMMYVSYPSLDNAQRLRALETINWQGCCAFDAIATTLGNESIDSFNVEMTAGRPVLQIKQPHGVHATIDLRSGARIERFTEVEAKFTAARYLESLNAQGQLSYRELNEPDQWTVGSRLSHERGLQLISLGNPRDTELYISSKTGQVVLNTTGAQRFWNWIGPVTHWLYPTMLRQNSKLWSQIVIWVSLIGTFLSVIGVYIGVSQWLAMSKQNRRRGWSPHHGVHFWHHMLGLLFGLFTLSWIFSGLLSMNPFGLLESTGSNDEQLRIESLVLDGAQLTHVLKNIVNASHSTTDSVRLQTSSLNGRLYFLKFTKGGDADFPERVAALTLQYSPLSRADVEQAAAQLKPGAKMLAVDLLTQGDAYYYSHRDHRRFPVYRVLLNDQEQTRYYMNANSAAIVEKADVNARRFRWWFNALHRWDFINGLQRPWWDALVLPFLLGVAAVSLTGTYMAYRRITPKRLVVR